MTSIYRASRVVLIPVLLLAIVLAEAQPARSGASLSIQSPVLRQANLGCASSSSCETGWYSSPAVADLDGDGDAEIVAAAYSIVILDGAGGGLVRRISPGYGRQWPSLVVADLEGDGDLEIVTAHGNGSLQVLTHTGDLVWVRQPTPNELRSLGVYDLDGDGNLEIITASTRSYDQWFVYEHNGDWRSGEWPVLADTSPGYAAGCYNENLAAADLDGDGLGEIIGPNDTHYVAAFHADGSQVAAGSLYGGSKVWSQVGVHVDHNVDLRGYANCGVEHRPNFAASAPIIADANIDGILETVIVGNVYNCGTNPYTDLYEMPFIFNADRTRWQAGSYSWVQIPAPDGLAAPRSQDYNFIESNQPNPAAADLDGDGNLEILYPSYDGRMHAYWLDKTEHGAWPYAVTNPAEGVLRFAGEPAVADLDGDGKAEVIFASWVQKNSGKTGKLHILDYLGNPIHEVSLPPAAGSATWNGALAAPTLANLDADADLEVVLNTAHSGVVTYDLPGTANAYILWGTGRGSSLRSGSLAAGNLQSTRVRFGSKTASPGDTIQFEIVLLNPGPSLNGAAVSNPIPLGVSFAGGLSSSGGTAQYSGGVVTWSGSVPRGGSIIIRYDVTVAPTATSLWINNAVQISDGRGGHLTRQDTLIASGFQIGLPLILRR